MCDVNFHQLNEKWYAYVCQQEQSTIRFETPLPNKSLSYCFTAVRSQSMASFGASKRTEMRLILGRRKTYEKKIPWIRLTNGRQWCWINWSTIEQSVIFCWLMRRLLDILVLSWRDQLGQYPSCQDDILTLKIVVLILVRVGEMALSML